MKNQTIGYMSKTIGIDATNIRAGGGVTHITELLNNYNSSEFKKTKIIIWGHHNILKKIKEDRCIKKIELKNRLDNPIIREIWKLLFFTSELKSNKVDLLFVPGGIYFGTFKPFVYMSQNMLVFDEKERRRYGFSLTRIRLKILSYLQKRTYLKSKKAIFISNYAKEIIEKKYGVKNSLLIHHGISNNFFSEPKSTLSDPIKITYISIIDVYKHQDNVAQAVLNLNEKGYQIELTLIGNYYPKSLKKLRKIISNSQFQNSIKILGYISHSVMPSKYKETDLIIFASTCENMPNILIESMSSGKPVLCSNFQPMPEFLKDAGLYFDPTSITDIERVILEAIQNQEKMLNLAKKASEYAKDYSWEKCANETFKFLLQE